MGELQIQNLSISYGTGDSKLSICSDFNLTVEPGTIVGVLGPNGTGKTSLIKSILNLETSWQGAINKIGTNESSNLVTYIPQNFQESFFTWTSVNRNIQMACEDQYRGNLNDRISKLKTALGIQYNFSLKPKKCSGGMLQQAAILRALVNHKGILVGDEPFSSLDVHIVDTIKRSFRSIVEKERIACLLIMHNLPDLASICDRILLIPNKPYSSIDKPGHYKIQEFSNSKIAHFLNSKEQSSLLKLAADYFNPSS